MDKIYDTSTESLEPVLPGIAQVQTKAWRDYLVGKNRPNDPKAFFIRLEDILKVLNIDQNLLPANYSRSGIRVYMAMENVPQSQNHPDGTRTHLYVVGTQRQIINNLPQEWDILENASGDSLIYDTTLPCPDLCSNNNILNTSPATNVTVNIE